MTDPGQKVDLPAVLKQILPHLLRHSRLIADCSKGYGWAVPIMAVLSLLISVAETLAIGLVVVFLYEAIGPGAQATASSGLLAAVLDLVRGLGGDTAIALAAAIFGLVLAKALFKVGYDMLIAHIKHVIIERARIAVYQQLLDVSYGYVQSRERGDLMNVLAAQTWAVADAFYCLARIGAALVAIAVFGVILIAISWQITLLAAISAALMFAVLRLLTGPTRRLGEAATEAHRKLSGEMLNTLQGMRTIRAYGQEGARRALFEAAARRTRKKFVRMEQLSSVITPVSEITYLGLLALIVWLSSASGTSFAVTLSAVALLYRLQPHLRELE
ncbi:MAG TPA: ABC transporter ATP-binding protein, partial [Roseiflexaceae bacterium]|nr:ABC transporter ATP-binding protein [Roseiflexaceae bacterium]